MGNPSQGRSLAFSSDGNYLAVGGPSDNSNQGAVWIFMRENATNWAQQGYKLGISTSSPNPPYLGSSVAFASDGSILAVGGADDFNGTGTVVIFSRTGDNWSELQRLTGPVEYTFFGASVALSYDGLTLAVGAPGYGGEFKGAVYVFTNSGGSWTQQAVLTAADADQYAYLGQTVSLSADGNTLATGGPQNGEGLGAVWIFARSGTSWSPQGSKLVGTTDTLVCNQGLSVQISSDGNTVIFGGPQDGEREGAVWTFQRTGGAWAQLGVKLSVNQTGNETEPFQFGWSVALSDDAKVLAVGVPDKDEGRGATLIYIRDSAASEWVLQGSTMARNSSGLGTHEGWSVGLTGDGLLLASGAPGEGAYGAVWMLDFHPSAYATASSIPPGSGPGKGLKF
jgi:hypothetical protein